MRTPSAVWALIGTAPIQTISNSAIRINAGRFIAGIPQGMNANVSFWLRQNIQRQGAGRNARRLKATEFWIQLLTRAEEGLRGGFVGFTARQGLGVKPNIG